MLLAAEWFATGSAPRIARQGTDRRERFATPFHPARSGSPPAPRCPGRRPAIWLKVILDRFINFLDLRRPCSRPFRQPLTVKLNLRPAWQPSPRATETGRTETAPPGCTVGITPYEEQSVPVPPPQLPRLVVQLIRFTAMARCNGTRTITARASTKASPRQQVELCKPV